MALALVVRHGPALNRHRGHIVIMLLSDSHTGFLSDGQWRDGLWRPDQHCSIQSDTHLK